MAKWMVFLCKRLGKYCLISSDPHSTLRAAKLNLLIASSVSQMLATYNSSKWGTIVSNLGWFFSTMASLRSPMVFSGSICTGNKDLSPWTQQTNLFLFSMVGSSRCVMLEVGERARDSHLIF
jgi:hypothetical protein